MHRTTLTGLILLCSGGIGVTATAIWFYSRDVEIDVSTGEPGAQLAWAVFLGSFALIVLSSMLLAWPQRPVEGAQG